MGSWMIWSLREPHHREVNLTFTEEGAGCKMLPQDDKTDVQEWLEIRKAEGLKTDPETAEVEWTYGYTMNPYGGQKDLPDEYKQIGRLYFARAPDSDISVSFADLPEAVTRSLQQKEVLKEIVELAQLQQEISAHDEVCPSCMEALERGMKRLFQAGMFAMLMA